MGGMAVETEDEGVIILNSSASNTFVRLRMRSAGEPELVIETDGHTLFFPIQPVNMFAMLIEIANAAMIYEASRHGGYN